MRNEDGGSITIGNDVFTACFFTATHPHMFRVGQRARIEGFVARNGRPCFHVRYPDGVEDFTPLENEDFTGKGTFYEISAG